jgi:Fe2+ or Zn2+ uptake regulation protein
MNVAMQHATEQGFTPVTHRLDIVGLCADCAARQRA